MSASTTLIDLDAARDFMTTHARVLDRRRFDLLVDGDGAEEVLGALSGYRNADGGYGWGLEPDLRSPSSQIAGALHAFEAIGEAAAAGATAPVAVAALGDWLQSIALDDGGLPFSAPGAAGAGTAPFFADADPGVSNLQLTGAVVSKALEAAVHDPAIGEHPWLAAAGDYVWEASSRLGSNAQSLELHYALECLDAMAPGRPEATELIGRLMADNIPPSGIRPVEGGSEGESMRPLDWSPLPDRPTRDHLADGVVDEHLDQITADQQPDGGWDVDFAHFSPAAALEWRGYRTVLVLQLLKANGRALG